MRSNLARNLGLFIAAAGWVFFMLALGSFHTTDWPSHAVEPAGPVLNLCGSAGAAVAYLAFRIMGQGVFPVMFFTGVCLVIHVFHNKVGDLWMRSIGLVLLSTAFAAAVHHFRPGNYDGFPEGQGGLIGIATAHFLQHYFSNTGTLVILATTLLVGLLLAADDLVLRTPAVVSGAMSHFKQHAPKWKMHLPAIAAAPKLPTMGNWLAAKSAMLANVRGTKSNTARRSADDDEDDEPLKPPVILQRDKPVKTVAVATRTLLDDDDNDLIDLTYPEDMEDGPAAASADPAHHDESDPLPSALAVVPSPQEQAVRPLTPAPVYLSDSEAAPPPPKTDIIVKLPNFIKPRQTSPPTMTEAKELGEYHLPAWDLLDEAEHGFAESQEAFVREMAAILEQALREFQIDAKVTEIDTGPVITMYEISLAPGIKVSTITALSNDIMRALKAESVRIVAPVPGKNTVGIEVPNAQKEKVRLKELMQLAPEAATKQTIPLYLGKDASGEPLITDLAAMPHCLIAGTTGSGKSVCINSIIMSILYKQRPDMVKLILVDPKVVEMAPFKDIPHLMCPVINETGRATSVLDWACEKMDERYEVLAEAGVRNIKGYNSLTREELIERFQPSTPEEEAKIPKHMPYIVIIIDELADLMMTSGKEVESFIVRLAQKSRAVGIHLILATQRPAATVVTGLIKSNMPSRIAFRVASKMDSRIVLDQNGADLLLGHGDMLFLPPGASKPIRAQGTFIDDKEIRDTVKLVKTMADAQYEPELVQIKSLNTDGDMEKDELFDDAVRIVIETKRGSVSLLQRRLTIGYSRASRLIEQMAVSGILGEYKGSQAREVNITLEQWNAMQDAARSDAQDGMTA
jgi:S-DNA-T family DNA segregation ATPase FtsK/SpoIIIE